MLGQRVLTVIVLFAVLFPTLYFGSKPVIAGLLLLFLIAASWEWTRLLVANRPDRLSIMRLVPVGFTVLALLLGYYLSAAQSLWFCAAATLVWLVAIPVGLSRGISIEATPLPLAIGINLFVLLATWIGVCHMVGRGAAYMLSVAALIWVSDIAAYFSGRAFGRHKLAPRISPGKTWEGVIGAVLVTLLVAYGFAHWVPQQLPSNFISDLFNRWPVGIALAWLIGLTGLGIVGDLFESWLKRRAQVKDSSGLLPGHGGVFDRIDALLPVFPAALCIDLAGSWR